MSTFQGYRGCIIQTLKNKKHTKNIKKTKKQNEQKT